MEKIIFSSISKKRQDLLIKEMSRKNRSSLNPNLSLEDTIIEKIDWINRLGANDYAKMYHKIHRFNEFLNMTNENNR